MLEINLHRQWLTPKSTIGEVFYSQEGKPKELMAYSLEDMVRPPGIKIFGKTAIPEGRYRVILTWSEVFKRLMPELSNVPGFSGVRIHPGNTDADTMGCILLGRTRGFDHIGESLLAYAAFCRRYCEAVNKGEAVWLNIHGHPRPDRDLQVA